MPYSDISELPEEQFGQYSDDAKQAAMDAFNGCMYQGEGTESDCFAMAHTAAKRVDGAGQQQGAPGGQPTAQPRGERSY